MGVDSEGLDEGLVVTTTPGREIGMSLRQMASGDDRVWLLWHGLSW